MNKRVSNLEFRCVDDTINKGQSDHRSRAEIVRWYDREVGDPFCCTILYWSKDKEGWDITFVGDRPFDNEINQPLLWTLMKYGQRILDCNFRLEEEMKDIYI